MARSEITVDINMEPTVETLLCSKFLVEMWLNASPGRGARVETHYDDDGNTTQNIVIFDVNTGDEWGTI